MDQAHNADRGRRLGETGRIELEGTGLGNPLTVFAELGHSAAAHGLRMFVDDPVALATGHGRFTIDVPNANRTKDAVAVVRALLDRVPGAGAAFTIVTVASAEDKSLGASAGRAA